MPRVPTSYSSIHVECVPNVGNKRVTDEFDIAAFGNLVLKHQAWVTLTLVFFLQDAVRRLFSADDAFVRKNEEIEMVATTATINVDSEEKSVTGASMGSVSQT